MQEFISGSLKESLQYIFEKIMSLADCALIDLPTFSDSRGELTFLENNKNIPFAIKRIYYFYQVPKTTLKRGAHGHKELQQLIIPISGSFNVVLDDGIFRQTFTLNNPAQGLYVCSMMWREVNHFSDNAVGLVVASALYDENDYFREYSTFLQATVAA